MAARVYAVTFDSRLHPSCDLEIANRVAAELGGVHKVIHVNELEQEAIRMNPVNRCYLCKKHLFVNLKEMAKSLVQRLLWMEPMKMTTMYTARASRH